MSISRKKAGKYIQSLSELNSKDLELIKKAFRTYMDCEAYKGLDQKTRYHIETYYHYFLDAWIVNCEAGKDLAYLDNMTSGGFKLMTDAIQGGHDHGNDWALGQLRRLRELKEMISEVCELQHGIKVDAVKNYDQM